MALRIGIAQLSSIKARDIFFDANVLVYLFWPTNSYWEGKYSSLYGKLLRLKLDFYVDFIIISEFVNRVLKLEHKNFLQQNCIFEQDLKYKDYRNSPEGLDVANDIYKIVECNILKYFKLVGRGFDSSDIISFLTADKLDFNDKAIVKVCSENNYVLLTNDIDFSDSEIDILSLNNKLKK